MAEILLSGQVVEEQLQIHTLVCEFVCHLQPSGKISVCVCVREREREREISSVCESQNKKTSARLMASTTSDTSSSGKHNAHTST